MIEMSDKGWPKKRHDSAGECETCGWDLDRYGDCTNTTCPDLDEEDEN